MHSQPTGCLSGLGEGLGSCSRAPKRCHSPCGWELGTQLQLQLRRVPRTQRAREGQCEGLTAKPPAPLLFAVTAVPSVQALPRHASDGPVQEGAQHPHGAAPLPGRPLLRAAPQRGAAAPSPNPNPPPPSLPGALRFHLLPPGSPRGAPRTRAQVRPVPSSPSSGPGAAAALPPGGGRARSPPFPPRS